MKKLKLNLQDIEGAEVLSREQLKMVMGGDGSGDGTCTYKCPSGLKECSSPTGDCKDEENGVVVVAIICDGIRHDC